eukprot:gene19357-21277_t
MAENTIIRLVQAAAFEVELRVLKNVSRDKDEILRGERRILKKASSLFKLDPFLDENGIVRVGGRMKKSCFDEECKHPILLPKKGKVTELVIDLCHRKAQHAGRGMTLNEIRSSGYWIINANSKVRQFISRCVRCRSLRGKLGEQKMADLPEERVTEAPPFTYCGVDLFGPFVIKERRKELKRYGVLFTCFGSRAIHIETTNSLDTDSFIQALRRFIARRGSVRQIYSDNGTNFVGTVNELQKEFEKMDQSKISRFAHNQNTDWILWKKNVPAASHMGGVWERQIRSVRAILSSLLKNHGHSLDDESLRTLLTESEAIVNSRPLTVETLSDPHSVRPLTPNHLLTMKSKVIMPPPGVFQKADLYCRRRWRRVQRLLNEFWSRWKKEYLMLLQPRQKWTEPRRNFRIGDVVLLKESSDRNDWPMGKVIIANADRNGFVRSVTLLLAKRDDNDTIHRKLDRPSWYSCKTKKRKKKNSEKSVFRWRNREPPVTNSDFKGAAISLPPQDFDQSKPFWYFTQFWDIDMTNHLVEQMHLYSVQKTGKSTNTNRKELEQLIGIMLKIGIVKMPRYQNYW